MIEAVNVSIVLVQDSNFLLLKRAMDEDVFPGYWGIPGGTVESDDSDLETALARECLEEIGVKISVKKLISNNMVNKNGKAVLYMVFIGKVTSGKPKPLDGTEKVKWKTLEEAESLKLTPKTLDMLKIADQNGDTK